LLLNAAALERGRAALDSVGFERLECLFVGDLAEELVDVSPYLGQLAGMDEASAASARALLTGGAAIWVQPESPPPESPVPSFERVHRHLRKFNTVWDADGDPLYLRYADRNVLPPLLAVLTPQQRGGFFGPVARFAVVDAQGEATWLERAAPPDEGRSVALRLTEAQMHALTLNIRPALLFDLEQHLRQRRPDLFRIHGTGYLRWVIYDTVELAAPFRIDDVYSLRAFLTLRFSIAPGFYKQPRIAAVLAQTGRPAAERMAELATEPYAEAWLDAHRFDSPREWRERLWGAEFFDRLERGES
jgi:hypothetical protein